MYGVYDAYRVKQCSESTLDMKRRLEVYETGIDRHQKSRWQAPGWRLTNYTTETAGRVLVLRRGEQEVWVVGEYNQSFATLRRQHSGSYHVDFASEWDCGAPDHADVLLRVHTRDIVFYIPGGRSTYWSRLRHPRTMDDVLQCMGTEQPVRSLWSGLEPSELVERPCLTLRQQGAGNGKTYGIWRSILTTDGMDTVYVVVKTHPARDVLLQELRSQWSRGDTHVREHAVEAAPAIETHGRQTWVQFTRRRTGTIVRAVIATMDSLVCGLVVPSGRTGHLELFKQRVADLAEDGATKVTGGMVRYSGKRTPFGPGAHLWIDEGQDFQEDYYEAIVRTMADHGIDTTIVGDKLQSLAHHLNVFTRSGSSGSATVTLVQETPSNDNRRIKVEGMAEAVNRLVRFDAHALPPIQVAGGTCATGEEEVIERISVPASNYGAAGAWWADEYADKIMEKVKVQVARGFDKPEHYLFVVPLVSCSKPASLLVERLQEYWTEKLGQRGGDRTYAFRHTSIENRPIKLEVSVHASRIVSVHTAKGDGRPVVFLLEYTKSALECMTSKGGGDSTDGLRLESFWHVGLTRAEHKIYIAVEEGRSDMFTARLTDAGVPDPCCPIFPSGLHVESVVDDLDPACTHLRDVVKWLGGHTHAHEETDDKQRGRTDDVYMRIRNSLFYTSVVQYVLEHRPSTDDDSLAVRASIMSDLILGNKFQLFRIVKNYQTHLYKYRLQPKHKLTLKYRRFPFYRYPHPTGTVEPYHQQADDIDAALRSVSQKIKKKDGTPHTVRESLAQLHGLEVMSRVYSASHQTLGIFTLYDVFRDLAAPSTEKRMYEQSMDMARVVADRMGDMLRCPSINWNIFHNVRFGKYDTSFATLQTRFVVIGHDDDTVYHIQLVPSYSAVSHSAVMLRALLERFCLYNAGDPADPTDSNRKRYGGKRIQTHIFTLDQQRVIRLDNDEWTQREKEIQDSVRDMLVAYTVRRAYGIHGPQLYKWYHALVSSSAPEHAQRSVCAKAPKGIVCDFFAWVNRRRKWHLLDEEETFGEQFTAHIKRKCDHVYN